MSIARSMLAAIALVGGLAPAAGAQTESESLVGKWSCPASDRESGPMDFDFTADGRAAIHTRLKSGEKRLTGAWKIEDKRLAVVLDERDKLGNALTLVSTVAQTSAGILLFAMTGSDLCQRVTSGD